MVNVIKQMWNVIKCDRANSVLLETEEITENWNLKKQFCGYVGLRGCAGSFNCSGEITSKT